MLAYYSAVPPGTKIITRTSSRKLKGLPLVITLRAIGRLRIDDKCHGITRETYLRSGTGTTEGHY